jgi:4-aminobutyrate aminotransferase-like enzyme/Ser/Thr protein kinase RdoA (MazF antagonist)
MTTFDFFSDSELRVPVINVSDAALLAATHFGINASVTALGSQQDANFLLFSGDGTELGVLKVANPAFTRVEIDAQDAAARYIADREPSVRTSRNVEPAGHDAVAEITTVTAGGSGSTVYARVIRYLPGGTLSGDRYVSPARWAALGTLAGRASRVLAEFDHPGVDRVLQWDLQHADRTIELLAPHVAATGRRALIQQEAQTAWRAVSALADRLPVQVIHGDLTDDNAVCSTDAAQLPDGIIDFGDLTRSWAIGELAIAASAVLRHAGGEPAGVLPMVAAFHAQRPLSAVEIAALWPLVILRAATLVVSGHQQVAIDHENDYATGALEAEWRIFERAVEVPADVMTGLIADALGVGSPVSAASGARLIHGAGPGLLDLSTESDVLDEGRWLHTDCEDRLAAAVLGAGVPVVATRYGQPRLSRSVALSNESPATVPTGIDVWVGADTPLSAPWAGLVTGVAEHELSFAGDHGTLHVRGATVTPAVVVGHSVQQGALLGSATTGRLWLQITDESTRQIPAFVRPQYAPGWLSLTRDPSALVGLQPAPHAEEGSAGLLARRGRSFASVQEQYYAQPPRIERGWREYLQDNDGRSYLDMVNNVTSIGHGHPELAAAVARQWRRLNTNSRFNYGAVVEFSERLAATLPDPLDTVFLVNSGSEAVDLALRLAFTTTGRQDVVAVAEAYHGWTYATDAISTSVADNPNALSTRPDWVHTVPSPNSFRGQYRGADATRYAADAVAIIDGLAAAGRPPAAFVAEAFYGNAGGVALPDGYLDAVYRAVRAAGGLAIADEVQVGYGRLGGWFWGFQQQAVLPDIVTVAKAMGNGQPLGAVITTKAIAEAYRNEGYFFSSAGGSPVSSIVGLTVLDVIERDGLQQNALTVGAHLRTRLTELAERHPLIGAVHGSGLYMGVELVRDRETLEPAATETAAICERMRELGVIVQPTGDHLCVLKMKPPMCLTVASADFFVDALDRVLSTGW